MRRGTRCLVRTGLLGSCSRLLPGKKGPGAQYRRLLQQKLFVTPGDVARYVYLPPETGSKEAVVSLYRRNGKQGRESGGYWLTTTQPSARLWSCIPTGDEKFTGTKPVDTRTISVQRCDAPLPASAAIAVRRVWLAMLAQRKPVPTAPSSIGSSTEIFSAVDLSGRLLQGQIPSGAKKNTSALFDLANSLAEYCDLPVSRRPEMARRIEKAATKLLTQVQSKK